MNARKPEFQLTDKEESHGYCALVYKSASESKIDIMVKQIAKRNPEILHIYFQCDLSLQLQVYALRQFRIKIPNALISIFDVEIDELIDMQQQARGIEQERTRHLN